MVLITSLAKFMCTLLSLIAVRPFALFFDSINAQARITDTIANLCKIFACEKWAVLAKVDLSIENKELFFKWFKTALINSFAEHFMSRCNRTGVIILFRQITFI